MVRSALLILASVFAGAATVPPPTPTTAVVTVKVGGDRSGTFSVGPLAGVELGLFATADATAPVDDGWGRCVSDADGDCSFVVPAAAAAGARYFVKQIAVPSGWYANPVLRTGPGSGSGSIESPYVFQTPPLQTGSTYSSTSDFMFSTDNALNTSSLGVWQQSRVNPVPPSACGVDAALLLDLSASVGSQLPELKAAADTFVDALVGTPSRLAVFSFSRTSPSAGADANHPELLPVSTQEGAQAFKDQYAGWEIASGTNWDDGLFKVAQAAPAYQVLVVITDGNPTRYADGSSGNGDGSNTHFRDVEAGIFSANAVKAKGTRVIALGVGRGVEGASGLNLRALSGPTAYDGTNTAVADYFQTSDYAQAGQALRELVLHQCAGSVTVIKQIVPPGNTGDDVTGATPAGAGWQFGASTGTPGAAVVPASATTTGDGTGSVGFEVDFPEGGAAADVSVTESPQPGFELVTPGGANAVCEDLATGGAVPVANTGATGFTVGVSLASAVSCQVFNRAQSPEIPATVTVDKEWIVTGELAPTSMASLTLDGSVQPWGEPRDGYAIGDSVTIAEDVSVPGCTLVSSRLTAANGVAVDAPLPQRVELPETANRFTVTNTVDCAGGSLPVTGSSYRLGALLLLAGTVLLTVRRRGKSAQ